MIYYEKKNLIVIAYVFSFVGLCFFTFSKNKIINIQSPKFYTTDKEGLLIINQVDKIALESVQNKF